MAKVEAKDSSLKRFREKCAEHGLKVTPQRTAIYEELFLSKEHPTADLIYKKVRNNLPNISFDTVNRTLITFSRVGVIRLVEGYGEAKRFDPDIEPHHHFRCIRCSSIIDLQVQAFDEIDIPRSISKQFNVLHKKVVLEGVCNNCQKGRK